MADEFFFIELNYGGRSRRFKVKWGDDQEVVRIGGPYRTIEEEIQAIAALFRRSRCTHAIFMDDPCVSEETERMYFRLLCGSGVRMYSAG